MQLAAGRGWYCYALKNDGSLFGWGNNDFGQINTPSNATGVTQVACGYAHTYALKNDGTLVGWGSNSSGQINTPSNATGVTQVACGDGHTYALKNDGTLVGWGYNGYGTSTTPSNLTTVIQVACGSSHTYALKNDGTVIGWGYNWGGQTNTPSNLTGVMQVACGSSHTYALKNDGTVIGWGYNGEFDVLNVPPHVSNVIQIVCGDEHTYVLQNNRKVIGWGRRDRGSIDTPADLFDAVQVAVAGNWTVALSENDCDSDGIPDRTTVAAGAVNDLNTNIIPDDCDLARGWEEDCDTNTLIDSYQQGVNLPFLVQSAQLGPIGAGSPRMAEVAAPPFTLSDPVLTLTVRGDFSLPSEFVTVYLNGRFVGQVFTDTGSDKNDCRSSITRQITLSRAFYNEMIDQGGGATAAAFEFVPSIAVNANQCPTGSWIRCDLSYTAAITGDCNANGLLDACETRDFPDTDTNDNGIVDTCENYSLVFLCPGDLDGGGSVDTADLSLLLMSFGAAMPGDPADLDGDQNINTADLSLMLLSFGPCG
jgi:hypothetical protein